MSNNVYKTLRIIILDVRILVIQFLFFLCCMGLFKEYGTVLKTSEVIILYYRKIKPKKKCWNKSQKLGSVRTLLKIPQRHPLEA
jgi:hypothetical protein